MAEIFRPQGFIMYLSHVRPEKTQIKRLIQKVQSVPDFALCKVLIE